MILFAVIHMPMLFRFEVVGNVEARQAVFTSSIRVNFFPLDTNFHCQQLLKATFQKIKRVCTDVSICQAGVSGIDFLFFSIQRSKYNK